MSSKRIFTGVLSILLTAVLTFQAFPAEAYAQGLETNDESTPVVQSEVAPDSDDASVSAPQAPPSTNTDTPVALQGEVVTQGNPEDSTDTQPAVAELQPAAVDTEITFTIKNGTTPLQPSQYRIKITAPGFEVTVDADKNTVTLPQGSYTYEVYYAAYEKRATGKLVVNEEAAEVDVVFPEEQYWVSSLQVVHPAVSDALFNGAIENRSTSYLLDSLVVNYSNTPSVTATLAPGISGLAGIASLALKATYFDMPMTSGSPFMYLGMMGFRMDEGSGPASFDIIAGFNDVVSEIQYTQTFTHTIDRTRTLSSVSVVAKGETLYSAAPTSSGIRVVIPADAEEVLITGTPAASYNSGNVFYVDNNAAHTENTVSVPMPIDEAEKTVNLAVINADGTRSDSFPCTLIRGVAQETIFTLKTGDSLELFNANGYRITPVTTDEGATPEEALSTFVLNEGEAYRYTAVRAGCYRVKGTFNAGLDASSIKPQFDETDYLERLSLTSSLGTELEQQNPAIQHESTVYISDRAAAEGSLNKLTVTLRDTVLSAKTINVCYLHSANGSSLNATLTSGTALELNTFLLQNSGKGNKIELVVQDTNEQGETVEQVYVINVRRELTFHVDTQPTLTVDGLTIKPRIENEQLVYYVPKATTEAAVSIRTTFADTEAMINGVLAEAAGTTAALKPYKHATMPLQSDLEEETLNVELSSADARGAYTLIVKKIEPIKTTIQTLPQTATLKLFNDSDELIPNDESGVYFLIPGSTYRYTLVEQGYISLDETFVAGVQNAMLKLIMTKALPNDAIDPDIEADWGQFRGENNSGVTDIQTPTSGKDTTAYWSVQGTQMSHLGQVIYANGCVVTFTSTGGNKIVMLDPLSGKVVAEGKMLAAGGTIPTFAEGVFYCPLSGSRVQAFNASPRPQTEEEIAAGTYSSKDVLVLDSLWYYQDVIGGGGANNAIYYEDGHLYANWFNSKTSALVCLTTTDEDPGNPLELKTARWRWERSAGFYWGGAVAAKGFVVVGGESASEGITCLDALTGEVLDHYAQTGNIRSSVSYDTGTDRFYCTSQGGYFYSLGVNEQGKFYDVKELYLGGALMNGKQGSGTSTSTPAIYNGRAYVGVAGAGGFEAYNGAHIAVIDLASLKVVYQAQTSGYCQASGLISTAYVDTPIYNPQSGKKETGFVYVYFTENAYPGTINYIIDKPGITQAIATDDAPEYPAGSANILFKPQAAHAQYNLSSITVDAYGAIYMKTDSTKIIALGSRIERLEIVQDPQKTVYFEGQTFDPTGIKVMACYASGLKRDVTQYMLYLHGDDILTENVNSIAAIFPYSLYGSGTSDAELDPSTEAAYAELGLEMPKIARPTVAININVLSSDQQASVEEVEKAIEAIGEVVYGQSKSLIDYARLMYNKLDAQPKQAVSNTQTLINAENRYQYLQALAGGNVAFAGVVSEDDQVDVVVSGPVELKTTEQDLLKGIAVTMDEALALEDEGKVTLYVESTKLERVPSADRLYLDAILQQGNLSETGTVFNVTLYKQIGDGAKTKVYSTLGSQKLQLNFEIPLDCREPGRVFRMVRIQSQVAEALSNGLAAQSNEFLCNTDLFSTFVLTYLKADGTVIENPNNPTGNVSVGTATPGTALPGTALAGGAQGNARGSGVAGNASLDKETTATEPKTAELSSPRESSRSNEADLPAAVMTDQEAPAATVQQESTNPNIIPAVALSAVALFAAATCIALLARKKKAQKANKEQDAS